MKFTIPFILLSLFYLSCSDNEELELSNVLDIPTEYISDNKETFKIEDASEAISFITKDGVTINFEAQSFNKDESLFSGSAIVDFVGIFNKTGMILSGLPTVARSWQGENDLLRSAGEYYLSVVDESSGQELVLRKNYEVLIPRNLTAPTDLTMYLFENRRGESNFWVTPDFISDGPPPVISNEEEYLMFYDKFGWINCDAFINRFEEKYDINFTFPTNYNRTNALVFISFDNFPFSMGDINASYPLGETGHLIFMAKSEEYFHVATTPIEIIEGLSIDFTNEEISKIKKENITDYLTNIVE